MSSTNSPGLVASYVSIVFTVLAATCVLARLIARVKILKIAGGDELTITFALLSSIAFTVFINLQVKHGLGRHIDTLSIENVQKVLKYLWASILPYNGSLALTKTAIVLQYLRVFVSRRTRIACWITIGMIALYGIWAIVSATFTCVPIALFWDSSLKGGCIPKKFLWFFNASINIITDAIILILPMPVVSTLRLPIKQKIGLIIIFALGGFVCLVSIIRLHSLYVLASSKDLTWDNTNTALWSAIECNVGIICASLPTIKPLISLLFPRWLSTNKSNTNPTGPSHNNPQNTMTNTTHQQSRSKLAQFRNTHIPLYDIGGGATSPKTIIEVEAQPLENYHHHGKAAGGGGGGAGDEKGGKGGGKDRKSHHRSVGNKESNGILVTSTLTMMTQDVETRSDMGSEKDLIVQNR